MEFNENIKNIKLNYENKISELNLNLKKIENEYDKIQIERYLSYAQSMPNIHSNITLHLMTNPKI